MTYLNKKSVFQAFNPFQFYSEMFTLGLKMQEMLVSSLIVIAHRNSMMNQVLLGNGSWIDPEFTLMWQEKMLANVESYNALHTSNSASSFSLHPNSFSQNIKRLSDSITPYHKKAKANAKRLSKKAKHKK